MSIKRLFGYPPRRCCANGLRRIEGRDSKSRSTVAKDTSVGRRRRVHLIREVLAQGQRRSETCFCGNPFDGHVGGFQQLLRLADALGGEPPVHGQARGFSKAAGESSPAHPRHIGEHIESQRQAVSGEMADQLRQIGRLMPWYVGQSSQRQRTKPLPV